MISDWTRPAETCLMRTRTTCPVSVFLGPEQTMKHLLRVGLVWATLAASATASSPAIRGMKPAGGQRGTEVKVTIAGQRLADARELTSTSPGSR